MREVIKGVLETELQGCTYHVRCENLDTQQCARPLHTFHIYFMNGVSLDVG